MEARSIPLGAGSGSGYAVDDVTLAIQRVVVKFLKKEMRN